MAKLLGLLYLFCCLGGWGEECQRPLVEKRGQWESTPKKKKKERTGLLTAGLGTFSFDGKRREMAVGYGSCNGTCDVI